mmetsp:Transcript_13510/g.13577  ORF Transcript_13510/g.13577 Transcript_13510/m.13577 type:complete len:186 (+) Transcript_13510:797-1354(+)
MAISLLLCNILNSAITVVTSSSVSWMFIFTVTMSSDETAVNGDQLSFSGEVDLEGVLGESTIVLCRTLRWESSLIVTKEVRSSYRFSLHGGRGDGESDAQGLGMVDDCVTTEYYDVIVLGVLTGVKGGGEGVVVDNVLLVGSSCLPLSIQSADANLSKGRLTLSMTFLVERTRRVLSRSGLKCRG